MTSSSSPRTRSPSRDAVDDQVTPFQVDALDLRGRIVRLGPTLDAVLAHHDYPVPVKRLVGEAVALAVLLGSTLKIAGRFILQTRTDGPVDLLVVDFSAPNDVRAYARFDAERLAGLDGGNGASGRPAGSGALLGRGHLAMTIDQGVQVNRYQGIVALDGGSLEDAAHQYFQQSEQIPTRVRLAVAEEMRAGGASSWRAGGAMVQFLPTDGGRALKADLAPGDAPEGMASHEVSEDEAWVEAQSLVGTLEDVELVDAALSSERLLFRLFHERGVRVFEPETINARCSCSRERVMNVLASFPREERAELVEDDKVTVTCEFCGRHYHFTAEEIVGDA